MSLKERLRVLFVCLVLEAGVLGGMPARPDEIRALMNQLNQPKLAHVLPGQQEDGDDPLPER